jgi:restriction endonuclease S subunit
MWMHELLKKMLIPLPSQKEQERIVKIFSKWDEAISKVSKTYRTAWAKKKNDSYKSY